MIRQYGIFKSAMAVSVRINSAMENELELAARRRGITKSQFIVDAVERAPGRKDPYALMMQLKAEEARPECKLLAKAFKSAELPYDTEKSHTALIARLRAKHGLGAD